MNNNPPNPKEPPLCYCTGTTKEKVQALLDEGFSSFEDIVNQTGATTGCGGCDYEVAEFIAEQQRQ